MNGVNCNTTPCPGPVILMPVNDCDAQIDKIGEHRSVRHRYP